ncbi:MAG TPA: nucleotidyltransferase [Firmicutes bacterium]|jgi:hypothetical protein|nr:nucleotidyltransferase [Bacillota bacterium]HBE07031.1 nucleotidyltransferase [Bacillota bacterium]HCF88487.1 nucleotidyltransferase [Bacillota bacterium]HCF92606.1 nucleotidyltransferase [Bacillota bacterium]HCM18789.1 nucleotidyltransferase [Bacillota bacterium]
MTITDIKNAVIQVASSYPVLSIDLFGSIASGENTEDSDVDLLVCFDEKVASLFDLSGLKLDIQEKLNTKVDVIAGPLQKNSFLTIDKKVRIYEA